MIFYYIRHGDPVYNPDSLTPLGSRQAEAVSKRLALYGLDRIYSSTSNRAIMTAQPTCEILKKEPVLLDFANEGHA
jgi:probable phosphoglycerate mutase